MKLNLIVKEVGKQIALDMIKKYHYSNTLPKLNKHYLGFFNDDSLVGIITLGWGTQPLGTIKKIFPSLTTNDYYEIGRMCMLDEMPRNSESQMISACVKWLKNNCPNIKVLFTWADGMLGKCGYVYQSCSFLYCGYSLTDIYLTNNGEKIHPRQCKKMFARENDKRIGVRPTFEQCEKNNIDHYRGKQFKYLKFLCNKSEQKKLVNECTYDLTNIYPKENDLKWYKQSGIGNWQESKMPPYKTDVRFNQKQFENIQLF